MYYKQLIINLIVLKIIMNLFFILMKILTSDIDSQLKLKSILTFNQVGSIVAVNQVFI